MPESQVQTPTATGASLSVSLSVCMCIPQGAHTWLCVSIQVQGAQWPRLVCLVSVFIYPRCLVFASLD